MCKEHCRVGYNTPFFVDISTKDQDVMFLSVRPRKNGKKKSKEEETENQMRMGDIRGSYSILLFLKSCHLPAGNNA